MARHQLAARLTRWFQVIWVNPSIHWRKVLSGPAAEKPGPGDPLVHAAERWLPRVHRPRSLARRLYAARLRRARHTLAARGCRRFVLYIWTPVAPALESGVPFDLRCYHLSDEYAFGEDEVPVPAFERRILEGVDQVFIHSRALLEKKGGFNPNTAWVPNGVDYEAHARPVPEPDDLREVRRPRIGYTGHLKAVLDWELVETLADRHPDWSFVLVGARKNLAEIGETLERLERRPNLHFLGKKTSDELARYPQHFDVCMMPYRLTAYTRYIYPLKLHEYLASGRPAVGSPIPALEEFGSLVPLPDTPQRWSEALRRCMAPEASTDEAREARQAVAREHDWDHLVERIANLVNERLAERS
jgi:glycosyltransferase involved in cell wall biosynthesis